MEVQASTAGAPTQQDQASGERDGDRIAGKENDGGQQGVAIDFWQTDQRKGRFCRDRG